MAQKKIVYLFGAGATHAELSQIVKEKEVAPSFLENNGLLTGDVSKRITKIINNAVAIYSSA